MCSKNVLFVSFSNMSTGEISYIKNALIIDGSAIPPEGAGDGERKGKGKEVRKEKVEYRFFIHQSMKNLLNGIPCIIIEHDFHKQRSFFALLRQLSQISTGNDFVIFLDLNSVFLESNLRTKDFNQLLNLWDKLNRQGIKIGVTDPLSAMERNESIYNERLRETEAGIDHLITAIRKRSHSGANSGFFTRFLKSRTLRQLFLLPDDVYIFKPVPPNRIQDSKSPHIRYYPIFPEKLEQKNSDQGKPEQHSGSGRTAIIALSSFMTKSVDGNTIKSMLSYTFKTVIRTMHIPEILVIDPSGILGQELVIGESRIRPLPRLPRQQFLEYLSRAYFVGAFTPYSSLGPLCVRNRIPFAYFTSSEFAGDLIDDPAVVSDSIIPPFHALGWWEDYACYNAMIKNNPYFEAITELDIADESGFKQFYRDIENGQIHRRMTSYQNSVDTMSALPIAQQISEILTL